MKPSKRGSLRTILSLPPFPDTEWPGAPTNTLSPGQGLLWGAGGFLDQKERARLSSASTTYEGWISSRCRSNCRAFSLSRRVLPRCFLVVSISSWICARTAATFSPAACALAVSALRMAFASHSTSALSHKGGAVSFSHITAIYKEVNHAYI